MQTDNCWCDVFQPMYADRTSTRSDWHALRRCPAHGGAAHGDRRAAKRMNLARRLFGLDSAA